MKKFTIYFYWILLVFIISSCKKNDEQLIKKAPEESVMNITDPQDPNLDPNWSWNDPNASHVNVYYITNGESNVKQLYPPYELHV